MNAPQSIKNGSIIRFSLNKGIKPDDCGRMSSPSVQERDGTLASVDYMCDETDEGRQYYTIQFADGFRLEYVSADRLLPLE